MFFVTECISVMSKKDELTAQLFLFSRGIRLMQLSQIQINEEDVLHRAANPRLGTRKADQSEVIHHMSLQFNIIG